MTRATLKDVAAHAGVSHQTVSNVLNNHPSIRPIMRERVLRSIAALDYHPNIAAKALREARVTTLCCVFYGHPADDIEDPYHNLIQSALISEAKACGYSLTTAFLEQDRTETFEALRRGFLQRQFGGVVVVGTTLQDAQARAFGEWGLPVVLYDIDVPGLGFPAITADYVGGMAELVAHHVARGRNRLTLLIPPEDGGSTTVDRREGYSQALRARGLSEHIVLGDWTFASGEQAFYEIWQGSQRPDAILCGNDRMAVGALQGARKLEVRVPEEVAISGFDDFEFSRYTAPNLTTVRVPYEQMARRAVRTLLERLENPSHPVESRQMPVLLMVRESS